MSETDNKLPLPDLESGAEIMPPAVPEPESADHNAADLEAVFDVPVKISAVLGRARMEVGELLKLGPGAVLELLPQGRRGDRHLRQQPPGRPRRGGAGRGQARHNHDRDHQGGAQLT
jgi:Type III flagellar switch regulator (C-ring) FliN C-term